MNKKEIREEIEFIKNFINERTANGTLTEKESESAWNRYSELERLLNE